MADAMKSPTDTVRVLVKAMTVLEVLAEVDREMSLNDISRRLEMNKSTCHRILNTLASREFVESGETPGTYRIGIGAFHVGAGVVRRLGVRDRSLNAMRALHAQTNETVFLCIPRGDEAICIERIDGLLASTHYLQLGGSLPLHIGAAPRVLLAAMDDRAIDDYLAAPLSSNTAHTPTSADELRPVITDIRRDDHAVSHDDVLVGVKAFGAPVRDYTGQVVAAVSLSAISANLPGDHEGEVLRLVKDAGVAASAAMGFRVGAEEDPTTQPG